MSFDTSFIQSMPFPNIDVMHYSLQFMPLSALGRCSAVCRAWSKQMNSPNLWLTMFDIEKYPRVEDGFPTAKEDFRFMHQCIYSAGKMAPLGQFVGVGGVPMISRETFERMKNEMDPVEKNIKMHVKHRFLVEPTHIFRDGFNKALYDDLIANGDFNDRDLKDGGMMIPYSAKNVKVLARHPAQGYEYPNPVFAFTDAHMASTFNQCSKVATKVNVSIHRMDAPVETVQKVFDAQNAWLQSNKYIMASFTQRLYFLVIEILTTGTCPDKDEVTTRTSDLVKVRDNSANPPVEEEIPVSIGNFEPGIGLFIDPYGKQAANARAAASLPVEFPALKGPSSNGKRSYDAALGNGN